MEEAKNKVSQEVAEAEFDRFCEEMDIENDESVLDEEDLTQWLKGKRRLVKAMMNGSLVINENGEAVYTPQKSGDIAPLTFHESTVADLMVMDGKKKGHDVRKTIGVIAAMTKTTPATLSKLRGVDSKVMLALFALLMD